jgi:hypothetical protein
MTDVRRFPAVNRLAGLLAGPDGRPARAMLAQADAVVEALRPAFDRELAARIAALEQLAAASAPMRAEIYDNASAIIDTAGLFGFDAVGEAAYALCDLVDALNEQGRWDASAVQVHVETLRLLRNLDTPAERDRLLAGLRAVFDKVTHR